MPRNLAGCSGWNYAPSCSMPSERDATPTQCEPAREPALEERAAQCTPAAKVEACCPDLT